MLLLRPESCHAAAVSECGAWFPRPPQSLFEEPSPDVPACRLWNRQVRLAEREGG